MALFAIFRPAATALSNWCQNRQSLWWHKILTFQPPASEAHSDAYGETHAPPNLTYAQNSSESWSGRRRTDRSTCTFARLHSAPHPAYAESQFRREAHRHLLGRWKIY